jgi:hypothetical protein
MDTYVTRCVQRGRVGGGRESRATTFARDTRTGAWQRWRPGQQAGTGGPCRLRLRRARTARKRARPRHTGGATRGGPAPRPLEAHLIGLHQGVVDAQVVSGAAQLRADRLELAAADAHKVAADLSRRAKVAPDGDGQGRRGACRAATRGLTALLLTAGC